MTNYDKHIDPWIDLVESGRIRSCKEQKALVKLVRRVLDSGEVFIDHKQADDYFGLCEYFPYKDIFEWQQFFLTLHLCVYRKSDGMPRWPDAMALIARGAGKDGTIALESMMLSSPYNTADANYDIDICANNQEQAMRPFLDLWEVLENPAHHKKLGKFYRYNREKIICKKTNATIQGRTNNAKGKDGLRSGCVVFNEYHQYENSDNINVFTTGLGKKAHPRRSIYTTNGDVRDGPLDDLIDDAHRILFGGEPDNGLLPFICKLDDKSQVDDPKNWEMANPSLPYLPSLMEETRKEYAEWKRNPGRLPAFMTKRMNLPQSKVEIVVTSWDNIAATNKPIPDQSGRSCVIGIDFSKVTDFVSVNAHFRELDTRYDINHSWLCLQSSDLPRLKIPWRQWAEDGLLTVVDDVEIHPELIGRYIDGLLGKYDVPGMAIDNYRAALMSRTLNELGFDAKDRKNLKMVQPSDIMKIVPVIDSCFVNHNFVWGNNPVLRWGTNNTNLNPCGKRYGVDTGNFYYGKIEHHTRKTDPFMSLVASMTIEDLLGDGVPRHTPDIGAFIY